MLPGYSAIGVHAFASQIMAVVIPAEGIEVGFQRLTPVWTITRNNNC